MASSILRIPRAPQCTQCLRNWEDLSLAAFRTPFNTSFQTQWRGKKKKVRLPETVNVLLLRDIAGYGRKGSIVPVAPGRMRNIWSADGRACYVPWRELKESRSKFVERDRSYGMKRDGTDNAEVEEEAKAATTSSVKLLSPSRTQDLLEQLLPRQIEFHRTPISTPSISTNDSQPNTYPPGSSDPEISKSIYGSVSVSDILSSIKAVLALKAQDTGSEDAARVVLGPEDVSIIRGSSMSAVEGDRIKALGKWEIGIQVRGGEVVKRSVLVLPQSSPEE